MPSVGMEKVNTSTYSQTLSDCILIIKSIDLKSFKVSCTSRKISHNFRRKWDTTEIFISSIYLKCSFCLYFLNTFSPQVRISLLLFSDFSTKNGMAWCTQTIVHVSKLTAQCKCHCQGNRALPWIIIHIILLLEYILFLSFRY